MTQSAERCRNSAWFKVPEINPKRPQGRAATVGIQARNPEILTLAEVIAMGLMWVTAERLVEV